MAGAHTKEVFSALREGDIVRLNEVLAAHPDAAMSVGNDGLTALQFAIYKRRHEFVKALLKCGALCSVYEAASLGDTAALERFLTADPTLLDTTGPDGFTPLHLAAHFSQGEALEVLLTRGADLGVRSTNVNANTPLHAAAAGSAVATARTLLASGADPDARDAGGHTPLHIAAASGAVAVVRALLDGGADPTATAKDGRTAADIARTRRQKEIAELLDAAVEDAQ